MCFLCDLDARQDDSLVSTCALASTRSRAPAGQPAVGGMVLLDELICRTDPGAHPRVHGLRGRKDRRNRSVRVMPSRGPV
eukprot:3198838-Pleurochrysis_carterae.AAC.1